MERIINIANDYSNVLGGRWIRLGPFSGEDFYNTKLEPAFREARDNGDTLVIELDGTKGYPSSFLDQSFGHLARTYGTDTVRSVLRFRGAVFGWVAEYIDTKVWTTPKAQK